MLRNDKVATFLTEVGKRFIVVFHFFFPTNEILGNLFMTLYCGLHKLAFNINKNLTKKNTPTEQKRRIF